MYPNTYQEGDRKFIALNQVSISVEPGEFVAVIGPSGSGKSTFLSIAGALLQPSEGNVIINGTNLFDLKPRNYRNYVLNKLALSYKLQILCLT